MVVEFGLSFAPVGHRHKDDMPIVLKGRRQGRLTEVDGSGGDGEDPDLELLEFPAAEDEAETDDDQEGKGEIPAEGGAVPEEFGVSGLEDGPHAFQVHGIVHAG